MYILSLITNNVISTQAGGSLGNCGGRIISADRVTLSADSVVDVVRITTLIENMTVFGQQVKDSYT